MINTCVFQDSRAEEEFAISHIDQAVRVDGEAGDVQQTADYILKNKGDILFFYRLEFRSVQISKWKSSMV